MSVPGRPPAQSQDQSPAPPPADPARRVQHAGAARWNKWSLARAREHWVGHRIKRELERAQEQEQPKKRKRRRKAVPRGVQRRRQVAGSCCRACDDGMMHARTEYRMSGFLVLVGYALFVPALLGLALNFMILATDSFGLADALSHAMKVPVPTIEMVMRVEKVTDAQMSLMTPEQQRAVRTARLATSGATLGGIGMKEDAAGVGVVVWLLAGLIGRLLTTKREFLRCGLCDARVEIEKGVAR